MNPATTVSSNPVQRGNALLSAFIVMSLAATIIISSTSSGVASRRTQAQDVHQSEAVSALEVVLARHQRQVIDMATNGRPEDFVTWNNNYGVDFVGGAEVRWKVEPAWAEHTLADNSTEIIENPMPGDAVGGPANARENRGSFYLYRISAEARWSSQVQHDAVTDANSQVRVAANSSDALARAVGVRYVVTPNSSALNYLLFYALKGPKADIELSHGPTVQLIGDIYSGGSIYWGSGTVCNDWVALKPSNGSTILGPPTATAAWANGASYVVGSLASSGGLVFQCKAAHTASILTQPAIGAGWKSLWQDVTACHAIGLDGHYRLSKQTLYGAINGFPMNSAPPSGYSVDACYYLLDPGPLKIFQGEKSSNTGSSYLMPDVATYPTDVFNATYKGTVINPSRARDMLATLPLSGADTQRVVNVPNGGVLTPVYLRGVDEGVSPAIGNDSRDQTRETGFVWKSGSKLAAAPGFNLMLRSTDNGAAPEDLVQDFVGRPEEPQKLQYFELDGDTTTDEHEYALPIFVAADGSTTTDILQRRTNVGQGIDAIEVPGKYISKAIGDSAYLGRMTDYTGWKVVDVNGVPVTTESSTGVGLVIRERPVPDPAYFTPSNVPSSSDPLYMPFSYGHVRTSNWPFVAADVAPGRTDVSSGLSYDLSTGSNIGRPWYSNASPLDTNPNRYRNTTSSVASQRYDLGGTVTFRSSCSPGSGWSGGTNDTNSIYYRFPYYIQDNWRFIALGKPQVDATSVNGLTGNYYNDRPNAGTVWLGPFGGRPVFTRTDPTLNLLAGTLTSGATGVASTYCSVRWTGLVAANYNDNYQFIAANGTQTGVRIWVNNQIILDTWYAVGGDRLSLRVPMVANQWVPIAIELYTQGSAAAIKLEWQSQSGSEIRKVVPTANLKTPATTLGTTPTYDWSAFTAVQTRIDSFVQSAGLTTAKAGLMLRAGEGQSPLLDGGDPYVALCWSPTRGVFAQIRGERAATAKGSRGSQFVGTATDGSGGAAITDVVNGEIPYSNPTLTASPNVYRLARLTPMLTSTSLTGSLTQGYQITTTNTPSSWNNSRFAFDTSPGSIPEGTVNQVAVGPLTLRQVKQPQARTVTNFSSSWSYRLGDTAAASQVFIPSGTTNDSGKALYMYLDRGGTTRAVNGTYPTNSIIGSLGTQSSFTTGTPAVTGTVINHNPSGTSSGGWVNWGTATDTGNVTAGSATTIWYIQSGSVDTRPQVKNGSTFVRYLSSAETAALMTAKTGLAYSVVAAIPAYPVAPAPTYNAGYPAASIPVIPATYPGYARLTAAITNVATTLNVTSSNGFAQGDILQLGTEQVRVNATPLAGATTLSVTRAQNGTVAAAWAIQKPISAMRGPMSVFKSTSSAATVNATASAAETVWYVWTVTGLFVGDILQSDAEQVQVTAIDAVNRSITVARAVNGTVLAAHNANTMLSSPAPVMSKLTATVTTAAQTLLTVASTAAIQVDDVLQMVNELVKVTAVNSATQVTVTRGYGYTPSAAAYPLNTTLQRTAPRTFSVSRGKDVVFDLNAWISAGCTPSRLPGGWLASHATDIGWYWSGLAQYMPWKSFWGTVTPQPSAGSLQPRVWDKSWTLTPRTTAPATSMPLLSAAPAIGDASFPTTVETAGAVATSGGRWLDDQPALWTSGRSYAIGDVIFTNSSLYRCKSAHVAAAATMPETGGTLGAWSSNWEKSAPWLRIERVGVTSKVRFLYAVSATTPTAADWRPVLVTPDTVLAAAPQSGIATTADGRVLEVDLARWFKSGRTTLGVAMTNVATTLTVASSVALNVAIDDYIQIDDEVMRVTNVAGSVLTVVRNCRNTLGAVPTHALNAEVVQASYRGSDLLVGLCAQSGSTTSYLDVKASKMQVETTAGTVDSSYWDNPGGALAVGVPNDLTRYLCSQYQVFWGPYDITEDFFYTGQSAGTRLANEDWIYNQREFWSQSRWWENGTEKDPNYVLPNAAGILSNREILAKTNILTLDMRAIQDYLKTTALTTAVADRVVGAGPAVPVIATDYTLKDHVTSDGLRIHASRYNRYPWNPNINGPNPWNPYLPNATSGLYTNASLEAVPLAARGAAFASASNGRIAVNHLDLVVANNLAPAFVPAPAAMYPALMPFTLASGTIPAGALWHVPACKPQDFHHAIRIINGSSIDWGYTGVNDKFGTSKMLFLTPNQLFIQGDLNTIPHQVDDRGVVVNKMTPLAIYCDNATFLSNAWLDDPMRVPGLTVSAAAVTYNASNPPAPSLAAGQVAGALLPVANTALLPTATYAAALLTHNQPTTKATAIMGESSSFINTMQFLEDWTGRNFVFVGSIVVMDTRRYTHAYLLDATKRAGIGPFGWMVANSTSTTAWTATYSPLPADALWPWPSASTAGNTWAGSAFAIYGAPNRSLFYNPDFRTKEGTPPQMPFGIKALGVGGWIKILR